MKQHFILTLTLFSLLFLGTLSAANVDQAELEQCFKSNGAGCSAEDTWGKVLGLLRPPQDGDPFCFGPPQPVQPDPALSPEQETYLQKQFQSGLTHHDGKVRHRGGGRAILDDGDMDLITDPTLGPLALKAYLAAAGAQYDTTADDGDDAPDVIPGTGTPMNDTDFEDFMTLVERMPPENRPLDHIAHTAFKNIVSQPQADGTPQERAQQLERMKNRLERVKALGAASVIWENQVAQEEQIHDTAKQELEAPADSPRPPTPPSRPSSSPAPPKPKTITIPPVPRLDTLTPAPAPAPIPVPVPTKPASHKKTPAITPSNVSTNKSVTAQSEPDYSSRNTIGATGGSLMLGALLATIWQFAQLEALRKKLADELNIPVAYVTNDFVADYLKNTVPCAESPLETATKFKNTLRLRNVFGAGTLGSAALTAIMTGLLHQRAQTA